MTPLVALALPLALAASALPPAPQTLPIRVLLERAPRASLVFDSAHAAAYADGAPLARSETALEWRLSLLPGNRIAVEARGGTLFDTGRDRLSFDSGGGFFRLSGKPYRGSAQVSARDGRLSVVNVLPLEDYVRGVLPAEMPSGWPEEALKAQAVIARTYAVSRLDPKADHDLCATSVCQVYGGAGVETPRADAAALATKGLILAHGNRPARTYFHADSGGHTASSREVWGEAVPYLVARPDPLSRAPGTPWRVVPEPATIERVLARLAPSVGAYRGLAVASRTESGRVAALEVRGAAGAATVAGRAAGDLLRSLGARSSLVSVASSLPLVLTGAGAGHGVGLSQWGARGLAAAGWRFEAILAHYYPGVSLSGYAVVAPPPQPAAKVGPLFIIRETRPIM